MQTRLVSWVISVLVLGVGCEAVPDRSDGGGDAGGDAGSDAGSDGGDEQPAEHVDNMGALAVACALDANDPRLATLTITGQADVGPGGRFCVELDHQTAQVLEVRAVDCGSGQVVDGSVVVECERAMNGPRTTMFSAEADVVLDEVGIDPTLRLQMCFGGDELDMVTPDCGSPDAGTGG